MTTYTSYLLDRLSVIDLVGADAGAILNNLTTNDVLKLAADKGCESFITDVRGKTVGHFLVFKTETGYRLVGASGQSERFAAHVDRYTIREDANPIVQDADFIGFVLSEAANKAANKKVFEDASVDFGEVPSGGSLRSGKSELGGVTCDRYDVPWINGSLVLVPLMNKTDVMSWFLQCGIKVKDESAFHVARTLANYPWYGMEVSETNLPQELSREEQTISFVKGCYLGQETVARLDAMGQVQKRLVRWSIELPVASGDVLPELLTTLQAAGKTVGRLTSIARQSDGGIIAIGFARRTHFDAGASAEGRLKNGTTFVATVIDNE